MIRQQSIRSKLTVLIASAVGLSLFLTFLFFTARDIEQHRAAKLAELFSDIGVILDGEIVERDGRWQMLEDGAYALSWIDRRDIATDRNTLVEPVAGRNWTSPAARA